MSRDQFQWYFVPRNVRKKTQNHCSRTPSLLESRYCKGLFLVNRGAESRVTKRLIGFLGFNSQKQAKYRVVHKAMEKVLFVCGLIDEVADHSALLIAAEIVVALVRLVVHVLLSVAVRLDNLC